jgi:hypothetical protein
MHILIALIPRGNHMETDTEIKGQQCSMQHKMELKVKHNIDEVICSQLS